MKVTIKHINNSNVKEVELFAKEKGLKPFHSLSFQFGQIPEGVYEIDLSYIFSNQYNTIETPNSKGFRIFEYCRVYKQNADDLTNIGYYIAEGIEEIREYQKRLKKCNYCGKQYLDSDLEFCEACRTSEYLEEKQYHLLRLTNICDEYSKEPLPVHIISDIKTKQIKANLQRENKRQKQALIDLQNEIKEKQLEFDVRKSLFENGFSSKEVDNLIYYSHTKQFCFGWREKVQDKQSLLDRLNKIDALKDLKFEIK